MQIILYLIEIIKLNYEVPQQVAQTRVMLKVNNTKRTGGSIRSYQLPSLNKANDRKGSNKCRQSYRTAYMYASILYLIYTYLQMCT